MTSPSSHPSSFLFPSDPLSPDPAVAPFLAPFVPGSLLSMWRASQYRTPTIDACPFALAAAMLGQRCTANTEIKALDSKHGAIKVAAA
eukprot:1049704-Rhodomonas_salina.1